MFFKFFAYVLLIFFSHHVLACDVPLSDVYPAITLNNGYVSFEKIVIPQDEGGDGLDKGISVFFYDCQREARGLIGTLPFLADTGRVADAFFAEVDSEKKLFVIHNVLIRSETQPGDTGDYYSVLVYKYQDGGYIEDRRLSSYFGKGSDVRTSLADNQFAYIYPYKTRQEILKRIRAEGFKRWATGIPIQLIVKTKTYIYEVPSIAAKTRMYLVPDDQVLQRTVEAGWVSIVYKTKTHRTITGWIPCAAVGGCEL